MPVFSWRDKMVNKNSFEDEEKTIKTAFGISFALIVMAILSPIVALNLYPGSEVDSFDIWFQRSGSLVVLFALWSEYTISRVDSHVNLNGIVTSDMSELSAKYKTIFFIIKFFGIILAISGTAIWGYGDLLIKI